MSTTITIPTELEKKIAGRAAAHGKDIEQFALEALERAAESPSLRELFADVREQIVSEASRRIVLHRSPILKLYSS